ncbi:MACPF domain-containing protein [Arachis hypogaea]|nr:MACPF domain-containing protein [Arachis hypogaea]
MALKVPANKAAEIAMGPLAVRGGFTGWSFNSNVSTSIKCDKGERTRFRSDVLSFNRIVITLASDLQNVIVVTGKNCAVICHYSKGSLGATVELSPRDLKMSEQFNRELSLTGKIPSGLFNAMFEFSGSWQKDAAHTKTLAFDGVLITLYTVALEKSQLVLCDHVKKAVPPYWDPPELARFIETFGTHIVVGMKMGGKDVIYLKQQHSSALQPADVQKRLKEMADRRFMDATGQYTIASDQVFPNEKFGIREQRLTFANMSPSSSYSHKEDIIFTCKRRGGSDNRSLPHNEWLQTVQLEPDVISMSFIPITSLLNGVPGSGFLSHAINLYLRYKPPIEELHQFLEFQLPRQWAPVFSELPLGPQRKQRSFSSLQFSFMGPKLYVNTSQVDVGNRPVTGLRLYLEGKKSNRLAIHLQHLTSLPKVFQLEDDPNGNFGASPMIRDSMRKFSGRISLMCALLLWNQRMKSKASEWDGSPGLGAKSGLISTLISQHFTATFQKPPPRPADVNINSAVYPGGPPVPVQAPKLLKFVDTTEMTRGPQETPGYWVVSGARLAVEKGRISLRVRYSLLTISLPDEEMLDDQ